MTSLLFSTYDAIIERLRGMGEYVPRLVMRLIMGWEFFEAGLEKFRGDNWFTSIQDSFPFPFNMVPADFSWNLSIVFEIGGAIALWLGLGTRFFAFSLLFLTFVATAAVHWPSMIGMWSDLLKGYAISDMGHGNFKLPLLFVVMLIPLVFNGAGKLSLDHLIRVWMGRPEPGPTMDGYAVGLGLAVLGFPFLMLIPTIGLSFLVIAALAAGYEWRKGRA
ncbi:MAG: DoxX family protein [Lysobacterales bacterium]